MSSLIKVGSLQSIFASVTRPHARFVDFHMLIRRSDFHSSVDFLAYTQPISIYFYRHGPGLLSSWPWSSIAMALDFHRRALPQVLSMEVNLGSSMHLHLNYPTEVDLQESQPCHMARVRLSHALQYF